MKLFDSHLHLSDAAFADDRDEVITHARAAGVIGMVTVASTPADARQAVAIAGMYPDIWATAGLHPHDARDHSDAAMGDLRSLAEEASVVAIGETGLDFHYEHSPREQQLAAFEAQLGLAEDLALPVVVHSREADADTVQFIRAFEGRVTGVLHCFSGGSDLLDAGLAAGWYVSFSGMVTFKKYGDADFVCRVPADRLLIETDSPYLAPVPRRGRRNEPSLLPHTCAAVAAIRGESPDETADVTFANACRLYGVEPAS